MAMVALSIMSSPEYYRGRNLSIEVLICLKITPFLKN